MISQKELKKYREVRIHKLLDVKDDGRRQTLRCPFHRERTPSFSLYPDNSYFCFGCGVSGQNAIDLLLESGAKFEEALEELKKFV